MTMLKSKEATDSVEEQMKIIGGGGTETVISIAISVNSLFFNENHDEKPPGL